MLTANPTILKALLKREYRYLLKSAIILMTKLLWINWIFNPNSKIRA